MEKKYFFNLDLLLFVNYHSITYFFSPFEYPNYLFILIREKFFVPSVLILILEYQ